MPKPKVCYVSADPRHSVTTGTIIHGQFPATVRAQQKDAESEASSKRWVLRQVPESFTVLPLIGQSAVPLELSCNYSFLGAAAGIVQVLSGSLQIYHAWERQIPNLGYAAYSLTIIPYILMSLINLVACMCQPQYPTMFLVRYRGLEAPRETSIDNDEMSLLPLNRMGTDATSEMQLKMEPELAGTVGEAYGDLSDINGGDTLHKVWHPSAHPGAGLIHIAPIRYYSNPSCDRTVYYNFGIDGLQVRQ